MKKWPWLVLLGLAAAAAAYARDNKTVVRGPLRTVPQVDMERYAGTWYEIARLPMPFQKQCVANVTADYALNPDQTIRVTNRCLDGAGRWSVAEGLARSQNPGNSKLSVTFLPKAWRWLPFGRAPYWIMALDNDYQNVMIGQPDRRYLWLLSRRPQMDEAVYRAYLAQAQAEGYDLAELIRTEQR